MTSLHHLVSMSRSLLRFKSIYRSSRIERSSTWTRSPQDGNSSRRPVPFGLAGHIHAHMKKRHNAYSEEAEPLSHTSDCNIHDAKDKDKISSDNINKYFKTHQDLKFALKDRTVEHIEMSLLPDIGQISLKKSLDIADAFFAHKYRQVMFLTVLLEHAEQKGFTAFTAREITHLMFYVFFHGSASHKLFYRLEQYLTENLDSFEVNDIGIVCLAYFRGMKRIVSHDLLDNICCRVLDDFDQLHENMLINILKTLRFSGYARISFFEDLSEKLLNSLYVENSTNLNVLMHIAMTYASSSIYSKKLNDALLKRFVRLVDQQRGSRNLRSKDIAKFVWAMGTFVHEMETERETYLKLVDVYGQLCEEQDQFHPESLADLLQGLTYLGIHPQPLIDRLLQPSNARILKDHAVYAKAFQLLLINNSVLVECPNYKGRLLSVDFLRSLRRMPGMTGDLDFELKSRQGLQEVLGSLQDMFGPQFAVCHFLLPHFTLADIEMRLNTSGKPVEFTAASAMPVLPSGGGIHATVTEDLISALSSQQSKTKREFVCRVAIQVVGQNQQFSNTDHLRGNYQTKLRHLRMLGYRVLMIGPEEARDLVTMTESDRRKYLLKGLRDLGLNAEPDLGQ